MRATHTGLALSLTLLLVACSREQPEGAPRAPDDTTAAPAEKTEPAAAAPAAAAQIAPTQGNTVTGALALAQSAAGVHITGSIQGLKPDAVEGRQHALEQDFDLLGRGCLHAPHGVTVHLIPEALS